MTLYANENYTVTTGLADGKDSYLVENRKTGIVEVSTTVLPDAIFAAAQLHDALVKQPWTWFEKQDDGAKAHDVLM